MKSCACDYCNYHGICGFDAKLAGNSYRKIWPKTNDDVFSEIRRESDVPSEDRKGNEVNDVVPSEDEIAGRTSGFKFIGGRRRVKSIER